MKIKLVNCVYEEKRIFEPMGLCYIAASLRNAGYEVEILDPRIYDFSLDDTVDHIMKDECEIVGMSVMSFYKSRVAELARKIRNRGFRGKIILGGISPTICTELYLRECNSIDAVMCGEGELIWVELAQKIEMGNCKKEYSEEWKKVLGLAYINHDGKVVFNKGRVRISNLDELPFMARDILEQNIGKYGKDKMFVPILSSRGCYGRCSYCWISAALDTQEGLRYRQRSVRSVVDEIEYLYNQYGITQFSFEDDNFINPGEAGIVRAKEFRDLLHEKNLDIVFSFQTRPDTVTREIIEIYKSAGLVKPYIGIESIEDDPISMDKRANGITYKEQIENVLQIFDELGYKPDIGRENFMELKFGYITFHPLTTVESFKNAVGFFKKYGLTPKRLVKKMNLLDGDMDVKQEFTEKKYITDGSTDYSFKSEKVELIYRYMCKYTKVVFEIRDQIRSIEKHLYIVEGSKDTIKELTDARNICDNLVYEYGEELAEIVTSIEEISSLENRLDIWSSRKIEYFNNMVSELDICGKINHAFIMYGVDDKMYDLYW